MSGPLPWSVGDELPPLELPPVDRLSLIRYAGASGDYNPIHTIDEEATRTGLPGIIQHGMLTMARMSQLLTPYQDSGFVERFQTRFVGMLFLGDRLVVAGRVTAVEEGDTATRVSVDLTASTDDGRPIAKGSIRFVWLGR